MFGLRDVRRQEDQLLIGGPLDGPHRHGVDGVAVDARELPWLRAREDQAGGRVGEAGGRKSDIEHSFVSIG